MGWELTVTRKKRGFNSYTMQQIKIMINHIIKEWYFTVGNFVILQYVDIPMGIGPAPFSANLSLYECEADFISSLIKIDKPRAIKFKNASRFINDECNLHDYTEFSKSFHVI